jgi:hypothetical protein
MEEIDVALNTYRVIILNEDPYSMIGRSEGAGFFLDVSDWPYIDYQPRIDAAESALEILAEHEHYEKCVDLRDYIKELKYEIQRLSKQNN